MKKLICMMLVVFSALAMLAISACDQDQCSNDLCITCCDTDMELEQAIRDRFQTGFSNWNQGYEAWLEWCDTLYEPDAYYNVYGQRLTLEEYKAMMGQLFTAYDIELGEFDNIIVEGLWGSIRYTVYITDKATGETSELKTMEFVLFKDNPEPTGVRVVEGWALSDNPLSVQ